MDRSISTSVNMIVPVYSKYKPKINLEVLSAKSAKYMLLFNFVAFILCFATDFYGLVSGFRMKNITPPPSKLCTSCSNISEPYTATTVFYDVPDLITMGANVLQTNFTSLRGWDIGSQPDVCTPVSLNYDVELWACSQSYGCGESFSTPNSNQYIPDTWLYVYSKENNILTTDMCKLKFEGFIHLTLFPVCYQYQVNYTIINISIISIISLKLLIIYICRRQYLAIPSFILIMLRLYIIIIQHCFLFHTLKRLQNLSLMTLNIRYHFSIN